MTKFVYMAEQVIQIEEDELVKLINSGCVVDAAFGTGGVALTYDDEKPYPDCVRQLLLIRGILNENCDGAGI